MAASTCGFSSGFDTGFCAVVAEEEVRQGGSGTGAGTLTTRRPSRRRRKVALEGFGHLALPIGAGDLSAEAALAGTGELALTGSGRLSHEQALVADVTFDSFSGEGSLAIAASVSASAALELTGGATLAVTVPIAAVADLPGLFALAPVLSSSAALTADTVLGVELSADATLSASRALAVEAMLDVPIGTGTLAVAGALAGAGPLVLHGVGDLSIDDEGTAVFLLLGIPG